MAKLNAFSIFDDKAQIFNVPFFFVHKGQASRAFSDLIGDRQSTIAHHPEDYSLYRVGEFDDVSGLMLGFVTPEFIARAIEYVDLAAKNGGVS